MGVIANIMAMCVSDYKGLLAARIVSGFSTSAYESLTFASIGDLYFVHQRGIRLSICQFISGGVSNGFHSKPIRVN